MCLTHSWPQQSLLFPQGEREGGRFPALLPSITIVSPGICCHWIIHWDTHHAIQCLSRSWYRDRLLAVKCSVEIGALSKKDHWMNEAIPYSRCCKVKSLVNESMSENSVIEQGLYFAAPWPKNILIHSMIFYWDSLRECGEGVDLGTRSRRD